MNKSLMPMILSCVAFLCVACANNDGPGTEADRVGVGASCERDDDCPQPDDASAPSQVCLDFDGGYCGIADCTGNEDCPDGSACVAHNDGVNYCFRICIDKDECNFNRDYDVASNCSSNIDFVDADTNVKACVPPSS